MMSKPAQQTRREPTAERLYDMRALILPVVISEVRSAGEALELERRHSIMAFMTITVEDTGTPDLRTLLGMYTQPVIAMGVLRCRYLLEFLVSRHA